MATKTKLAKIPNEEIEAAINYFTMSNMAVLDLMRTNHLIREYNQVDGIVESECGVGMNDERKSWVKEIKKAKEGDYCYDEWQKVKSNYTW